MDFNFEEKNVYEFLPNPILKILDKAGQIIFFKSFDLSTMFYLESELSIVPLKTFFMNSLDESKIVKPLLMCRPFFTREKTLNFELSPTLKILSTQTIYVNLKVISFKCAAHHHKKFQKFSIKIKHDDKSYQFDPFTLDYFEWIKTNVMFKSTNISTI